MTEPRAKVTFIDRGRFATEKPNPAYPDGVDLDISEGAMRACLIKLPYPAPRCGYWAVECMGCGLNALVTCAGRPDDPRSLKMACKALIH